VEEKYLHSFLYNNFTYLSERPHLSYYIKEMTLHVNTVNQMVNGQSIAYYNIKVRLLPEIVSAFCNPLVKEMIDATLQWNKTIDSAEMAPRPFTLKVGNNVSVSQGNVNYKRFLQMIGALDRVYDPAQGYACLLNV
jgi:hypothetical protein